MANRSGGKTLDFAITALLDAFGNDECECANFGAIQAQALRCYGYMKTFMEKQVDFIEQVKGEVTMKKTQFLNGSMAQVLTATMSGVNSPHPQKVKADEVELIPWSILQEALSMTQSKDDIQGITILGSTRKFAHGPMQRLIDDGEAKVFAWCAWEVMEKYPTDPVLQKQITDAIQKKFGSLDIMPKDLSRFSGYYKWKDFIAKIRSLDEETLRTQWFCEKADATGRIYPKFDDDLNVIREQDFILDTTGQMYSLQIWEDFGYAKGHPDSISFVQVDHRNMSFVQFDELSLTYMTTQDIIIEVIQKLQANGLVADELKEIPRSELEKMHNYAKFFTKVKLWIPDYHGLTEIADRQSMGCPVPTPAKITHESVHGACNIPNCPVKDISQIYLKENGIPHVRNFIDEGRAKMTTRNIQARFEFLSYSRKRKADGTYTDEPEKTNDHFPDNWHYGTVYNWYDIAYMPQSLEQAMPEKAQVQKYVQEGEIVEDHEMDDPMQDDGSFTSGIWEERF